MNDCDLRKQKAAVTVYSKQSSDVLIHRRAKTKLDFIQRISSNLLQLERMDAPNTQIYRVATTLI